MLINAWVASVPCCSVAFVRKRIHGVADGDHARSIMGALDIALTLHLEEPGLNINGEEWIKVMDEYIVPHCVALMELGRKFSLILDNAPSHASRLPCEHFKAVLHGICKSRRIASTFDPRVS